MSWRLKIYWLLLITYKNCNALFYPASSSMSMVASVSVPLPEFYPERRILIDWCFSIAFDLPSQVSSFYNIPIWPGFANLRTKREQATINHTDVAFYAKYGRNVSSEIHAKDFTAGELYGSIEDFFRSYGFHETCLLRSVCELARYPFDDNHRHLFSDILTFVLSPTQHEGFLDTENVYSQAYEQAELSGFLEKDCSLLYADCKHDILSFITNVV